MRSACGRQDSILFVRCRPLTAIKESRFFPGTFPMRYLHRSLRRVLAIIVSAVGLGAIPARSESNLLWNGGFHFQAFETSRDGGQNGSRTGSVPYWDQDTYGDAEVLRAPVNGVFRPQFAVDGLVVIHPGKSLRQLVLLHEAQLDHGDIVSLSVFGHQVKPGALRAAVCQMQLDDAAGEWSPAKFGQKDSRSFPRHARGELVRVEIGGSTSGSATDFELKIENARVTGAVIDDPARPGERANTLGVQVEFSNASDGDVWIYSPCLARGPIAQNRLPDQRELPDYYRHVPRTMNKLRRGEPLHVIVMGSSIDRASANPPLYLYDEDPRSAHFKEPVSSGDFLFDGKLVGHPEWTPFVGQWRHYFSFGGRLRQGLMRRYNYPIDRLLLNFMACDGSSIGESHSALETWSTLAEPPNPERNGQAAGPSWAQLHPAIFSRPEGPRPDLVIFGSGANEKIDGAEEVAVFEGAIRWFQRHYPGIEFVFCLWQNQEKGTAGGAMKDVALAYGIPFLDLGRELSLASRYISRLGFTPGDGHPQAAAHFLWGRLLERAFQPVDPMQAGLPQRHLPARVSPYAIGWEGDMKTYPDASPRVHDNAFILDDTVVNLWANSTEAKVSVLVDGKSSESPGFFSGSRLKPVKARDPRNSVFALGRLTLGDRHVVEVKGAGARIIAVDAKTALNRVWHGVGSRSWQLNELPVEAFASKWGAPYGAAKISLSPGRSMRLRWVGTDCSVAWAPASGAGTLVAKIDGVERLREPAGVPFTLASGRTAYLENRQGVRGLSYGVHELEIEAIGGPVAVLGAFTYDTRANLDGQHTLQGIAAPGDRVVFSTAFAAAPVVICSGGLQAQDVSREGITFSGEQTGSYQVTGEW